MQKGIFKKLNKRQIPAILWGFLIFYLTLSPQKASDHQFPIWLLTIKPDKIAHFLFWGIWYWIYDFSLRYRNPQYQVSVQVPLFRRSEFYTALMMILCGALVEFLQWYTDWGRSVEAMDFIADTLGVLLVFWLSNRKN